MAGCFALFAHSKAERRARQTAAIAERRAAARRAEEKRRSKWRRLRDAFARARLA